MMVVSDFALDRLLDQAVSREMAVDHRKTRRAWTEDEDRFLKENHGFLSEDEIGRQLGRTAVAVRIRWKRELNLVPPTKHPDYLTTRKIANALGIDYHAPPTWVDRGLLPGELLPFNGRKVRRVKRVRFLMWAVNPDNWIYFDPDGVVDPHLRRLIELKKVRWGDEWWKCGQVADYHQVSRRDVNRVARLGWLPGVQAIDPSGRYPDGAWNYWFFKRSDVVRFKFRRRGDPPKTRLSDELAGFLILCNAIGLSSNMIVKLIPGWHTGQVSYRLKQIRDQIPEICRRQGLDVQFREDGRLFADWRKYRHRFPSLCRAVNRYLAGNPKKEDIYQVRGILQSWVRWHFGPEHDLARLIWASHVKQDRLERARRAVWYLVGEDVLR